MDTYQVQQIQDLNKTACTQLQPNQNDNQSKSKQVPKAKHLLT
jgi:hypothetical protein